jgi:competence protein ComEA
MEQPLRGGFRGASRRAVMRVVGSRFAKPIARIALVAAGLSVLAVVGRTPVAGAVGGSTGAAVSLASSLLGGPSTSASPLEGGPADERPGDARGAIASGDRQRDDTARNDAPHPVGAQAPTPDAHSGGGLLPDPSRPSSRAPRAAPDDPVILNAATEADLRRLPGIGAKRADAIVALRGRLGRFHAVEDLLKVRGIGRATLKRLRPLIRLDPPAADARPPGPAATGISSPPPP